jgi:hypothetical protein
MSDASTCYPFMGLCFSNKIDLALIGTILIFLAGIFYNSSRIKKQQREARNRYLLAIKEEIALNIKGLRVTISHFPDNRS